MLKIPIQELSPQSTKATALTTEFPLTSKASQSIQRRRRRVFKILSSHSATTIQNLGRVPFLGVDRRRHVTATNLRHRCVTRHVSTTPSPLRDDFGIAGPRRRHPNLGSRRRRRPDVGR